VIKASAGAASIVPIVRVVNITNTVEALKKEGIWIYGAAGEAEDLVFHLDFNIDLAVVIGAEGKGIRPLGEEKLRSPLFNSNERTISSFNASVSAGMVLYELMRQRYHIPLSK